MVGRRLKARGAAKQVVGTATGNERLVTRGRRQRALGEAAQERSGVRNEAAGAVKAAAGTLTGRPGLRRAGRAQQAVGNLQQLG
jgi:uncharacterized protein YjbJ (UPF0337 family)